MNNKNFDSSWYTGIPTGWREYTIGSLFNTRNEKVNDTDYQPLSVTKNGIVLQMENVAKSDANDNRKKVLINDFVINSRSDRKQSCGVSKLDGSVSLINTVLYRKNSNYLLGKYPNYLMKNYGFAEEFYRWGHGIVADLWTTKWQEMKSIKLPVPPLSTQVEIQKILDKKCSQIDKLITIQEQEIEKLQAYKQSLITEVVTKGLDPDVDMKDSESIWIGLTPKHWKIKKLRYIANEFQKGSGITKEDIIEDGDISCVRYADLYTDYSYIFSECKIKTSLTLHTAPKYFSYGDLLFTCTGELVEEIGKSVAYLGQEECIAGGDIIICKHSQNPTFMGYALGSLYCQMQKSYGKRKLKVVHISLAEIKNILVTLPPLEEQIQIGNYLNQKCLHIDGLVELKKEKVDKLQRYKKSLIYEYVTGKKEVM